MSGLMSRGFILTASRVSNFAILMLSPLLLVRILDVDSYGRYQEFMIYATLLVTICGFGVDASLTYFLPRYPDKERQFVSQNSLLVLIISATLLLILFVARGDFLRLTTFDFVAPLIAYVFCFVNLNWLEYLWIAKGRTDLVLYYSAARLGIRVAVLLVVAYVSRDVDTIIWSVVSVEALRLAAVATYLFRAGLFTTRFERSHMMEQVRFSGPVGLAKLMQQSSRSFGKLFIGSTLGPAALAYYAVASYPLPMVQVIRGSIAEVVFPELVKVRDNPISALRLWQRTNIVFVALLFPMFVVLFWYSELFVTTLFTDEYSAAVPVFQIYLLWLLRRCFNADSLLRTKGRTGFMLTGTGLSVAINVVLMVILYWWLGIIGPALAYVISEVLLELYYLFLAKSELRLTFGSLVDWRGVSRIIGACVLSSPILVVGEYVPGPVFVRVPLASIAFLASCWFVSYRFGVVDIARISRYLLSLIPMQRRPL